MEAADTSASSEADATKSALNQASPGKSPLSAYLQKMEDMQREALETIYNVVDQPCRMMPTEEMDGFLMVRSTSLPRVELVSMSFLPICYVCSNTLGIVINIVYLLFMLIISLFGRNCPF